MKKLTLIPGIGYSMKKFSTILSWMTCVFLLTTLLQSCKKDNTPADPIKIPPPVEVDRTLNVTFDKTTISITLIDSAIVSINKKGGGNTYFQRFNKSGNKIETDISTLSKGEWTADIIIFARSAKDTATRQYVVTKEFISATNSSDVTMTGPNGTIADEWKPRVVLADQKKLVQVVVALDNTDPYFEIRLPDKTWQTVHIERYALLRDFGNELIANERWICTQSCYTNDNWIINKTAFIAFTAKVKQKNWNNGEIDVELTGNTPDKKLSFFYVYKR